MKSNFTDLTVKEIKKETSDCVSVSFLVPSELSDTFQYQSGQYLTLKTNINGDEVRRSYSICSSSFQNELRIAIKKIDGGVFSTFANDTLKVGDVISAMPPMGNFVLNTDATAENSYVAFAAGSGITPIISMIRSVMKNEPKSNFILFYGNRGTDSIIFKEELENLKDTYLQRLQIHHILSREALSSPLFKGHIDAEKCEKFAKVFFNPNEVSGFFMCGPEEMILSLKQTLLTLGVEPKKIHFELFGTNLKKKETTASKEAKIEIHSQITIIQDGNSFSFPLDSSGKNILDAALQNGADLPFACKGGVCCTCKAKVVKGKVTMDINYALEPEEVAEGYVLTCQAHPISEEVIVNFDEH